MGPLASLLGAALAAAPSPAVRAWEGTETIVTYEEGAPDVNPPFDLFAAGRFNYPYTMRLAVTDRKAPRAWRTLNLENEHLRVSVLPDLGGRLWRAVDKANGAQMFYANPSLKFAQVAYRGAWATFGIEFNFPVSHHWMTSSPVDHALVRNREGSASIVVGNVDLVYGMQWRVGLTLRPGRSVLEQTTTLYNRSDVRHRFYWWTNAAVESWDDSQLVYPMEFTATHGFTRIDTWPVDSDGVDLSRPGNHLKGAVSLFSHGSREPFMGVYHPRTRAGVVHWADPAELPAKKVWSWGGDAEGRDWRRALSDNESAEVEIQAGLFRNQETYAFLEPQESIHFREDWIPVRGIGGISRATPDAVLNVTRGLAGRPPVVSVGVQVTTRLAGGRLLVKDGERLLAEQSLDLDPAQTREATFPGLDPDKRYTVEIVDSVGRLLISHSEGRHDGVPRSEVTVGAQRARVVPDALQQSAGDFVERGTGQELEGKLLRAWSTYEEGRARFPGSFELARAAGRLAVGLKRFEEAAARLEEALDRDSNDAETQYYLGCARAALDDDAGARALWEASSHFRHTRPASLLQLGRQAARAQDVERAVRVLEAAVAMDPQLTRAGALEVALLRRAGRTTEARSRLARWRDRDPTSAILRYEGVRLGSPDPALGRHLAGDAQRVLEVAADYMGIGAWDDALRVLEHRYPSGAGVVSEPGAPAVARHPEIAYYRGYCRERLGRSGRADFQAASRMPTTYVFPQRAETIRVLRAALADDPLDATAHFMMGALALSGGRMEAAVDEWEQARRLDPHRPVLHRNLGLALLHDGQLERAHGVLAEGLAADPSNVEVYLALDQVLGLLGRPAVERVAALERHPDRSGLPPALVFKLVLALVEDSRFDAAERLFPGRFFPREEFGTNPRQVYIEMRLQRALQAAREGRRDEAARIAASLGAAVPDLPFTHDGMEAFLAGARVQYLLGDVFSIAGDEQTARRHWQAAADGHDAYPLTDAAFVVLARRRLGIGSEAERRAQLEAVLASWDNRLVSGTNFPGANAAGQGYFLKALDRDDQARAKLREALLLPDKMMSHYLSRAALSRSRRPRPARAVEHGGHAHVDRGPLTPAIDETLRAWRCGAASWSGRPGDRSRRCRCVP
jgi:tetratricopeptide (TPR) repeat protein